MLTAQLYGKTISGKTIAEIKRKASRIANGFQKAFDCMKVTDQEVGLECTFWRYNRKSPNNTIVLESGSKGAWKNESQIFASGRGQTATH